MGDRPVDNEIEDEDTEALLERSPTVIADQDAIVRDALVAEAESMARDYERRRQERRSRDQTPDESERSKRRDERRAEPSRPVPDDRRPGSTERRNPTGEVRRARSPRPGETAEKGDRERSRSERPRDRGAEPPPRETRSVPPPPPESGAHRARPAPGAERLPVPQPEVRRQRGGTDPGLREPPLIPVDPPLSTVDEMAVELEDVLRRLRLGWQELHRADRSALIAATGIAMGVFMPWASFPTRPLQPGISLGGVVHLALAVTATAIVIYRHRRRREFSRSERKRRDRRISLYHILMGALSTLLGAYFFLMWGAQKSRAYPVEFHFGLYWTLFCGFGLSYGGFVRFRDPASKFP